MKTCLLNRIWASLCVSFITLSAATFSAQAFGNEGMGWGGDVMYGGDPSYGLILPPNHPPVADTGGTSTVVIAPDGNYGTVRLDGSHSHDPDGDPIFYFAWTDDDFNYLLAETKVTDITLPVGIWNITLTVYSDGFGFYGGYEASDRIVVEVITPAMAVERLAELCRESPLPTRAQQPLAATLNAAAASFTRSDSAAGLAQLGAFQQKVRAQIAPTNPTLAQEIIATAQAIIDAVSGH